MNKKTALRNLAVAALLIILSLAMTLTFLAYIQFFRAIPR